MIINERENRPDRILNVALAMLNAARTAPKGRGLDFVEAAVVTGDDIKRLSDEMLQLFEQTGKPVFNRDGHNILKAEAIVLIGVKKSPIGLNCGFCGFPTCADKPKSAPCAFNAVDTGIAVGSAVSVAADMRVDTRVMYSIGVAAMNLRLLGENVDLIFGIPLSCSSKNPFFDRQP
ncbi:MAG: ferredoxin [Muribaculaceae bacterium]|nr:ferredoxin [Muribaculaceae bacterium]MDE5970370.1 ferredoxin [Muribaculaceae bacterium]